MRTIHRVAFAAASGLLLLGASACGGNGDDSTQNSDEPAAEENNNDDSGDDSGSEDGADGEDGAGEEDMADGGMVGPGCSDYAKQVPSGAGSVEGMAKDPVAVAAGNNPMLKTLTQAVSGELNPKVNLVDTLNGDEFTVFAPVDDAFAKVPSKTIEGLKSDDKTLNSILTYHVVPGQLAPDAIAGSHDTVQGESVEVTGSGDDLKVGDAGVICGGVKTKNATVYLIDTVLMPPES